MTLHKLGPDPTPEEIGLMPKIRIAGRDGTVVEIDHPTDEQWEVQYGHWRYQCDFCGRSHDLRNWRGFGLSVRDAAQLSSWEVDVWDKLLAGDAHFCGSVCAGRYFIESVGSWACTVEFEPER